MNYEEKCDKLVELVREIEFQYGLDKDCGLDVVRYAIEDRVSVEAAVRSHRYAATRCNCARGGAK